MEMNELQFVRIVNHFAKNNFLNIAQFLWLIKFLEELKEDQVNLFR